MVHSHFGINQFFLDNGLEDGYETKLYFPADCVSCPTHSKAGTNTIFFLEPDGRVGHRLAKMIELIIGFPV